MKKLYNKTIIKQKSYIIKNYLIKKFDYKKLLK